MRDVPVWAEVGVAGYLTDPDRGQALQVITPHLGHEKRVVHCGACTQDAIGVGHGCNLHFQT